MMQLLELKDAIVKIVAITAMVVIVISTLNFIAWLLEKFA